MRKNRKISLKFNLEDFLCFFKEVKLIFSFFWKKILFFTLLIVSSLLCISVSESYTKSGSFELFYSTLTDRSKYNSFEKTHLEIKHFDSKESNKDLRNCVFNFNYADQTYCPYSINLSVTNRENSFFINKENEKVPSSILCPRTMTIKRNIKNQLKMETLNLFMLYEAYDGKYNSEWCYISSNYADKLLERYNFKEYIELLGANISVSYFVNGVEKTNSLTIRSIYDSNLGSAPYYEKVFSESMIITFIPLYYEIDNTILSVDLTDSLYANQNTIKFVEQNIDYSLNKYIFNFYSIKEIIEVDAFLNEKYENYINYVENNLIINIFTIFTGIFLIFSFVAIHLFNGKVVEKNIQKNNISLLIFALFYIIFCLMYLILKVINISLVLSNTITMWLLILIFNYLFFILSYKFSKVKYISERSELNEK